MVSIVGDSTFSDITRIETTDLALGGSLVGVPNTQLKEIADRTQWLKDQVDSLLAAATDVDAAIKAYWDARKVGAIQYFWKAPTNSQWLLCNGALFNTTTYPLLFSQLGTDRVPELRDRVILTAGISYLEEQYLGSADAVVVQHSHSDSGHIHSITDPNHGHPSTVPPHTHTATDSGHVHNFTRREQQNNGGVAGYTGGNDDSFFFTDVTQSGFAQITVGSTALSVSVTPQATGITIDSATSNIQSAGVSGTGANLPPVVTVKAYIYAA